MSELYCPFKKHVHFNYGSQDAQNATPNYTQEKFRKFIKEACIAWDISCQDDRKCSLVRK